MKEVRGNNTENQTIMTLLLSKSRKNIKNRRILYNLMLFGIIEHLLHEYLGNMIQCLREII